MKAKIKEDNPVNERAFYNAKILEELSTYLEKHKEIRFIQALWNLGIISRDAEGNIIDGFYEEPWITLDKLARVKK